MFRRWLGPNERETVATQVTMEDGTESPLVDHMRDAHQKGTRGYTEEYLDGLHRNLHQRKREPEEELEHRHPGVPSASGAPGAQHGEQRDSEVPRTCEAASGGYRGQQRAAPEAMNAKHRDREEQGMPETMKTKNRDRDSQRDSGAGNGQHRDRYQQQAPEVPDETNRRPQAQGTVQESANGEDRDREDRDREDQMDPAGARQRHGDGKHRKHRH